MKMNFQPLAFALLLPTLAQAHPHAWIDVQSTAVLSSSGLLTAISQVWQFDEMYTAAILQGMEKSSPEQDRLVREFAAEVIANLEPFFYFTRLIADDKQIMFTPPTQYKSELKNGLLQLHFTAPLAHPIDPHQQHVSYAVYDPTYYIHMAHLPETPPQIATPTQRSCRAHVQAPDPSPELIARAFTLDQNAKPDEDLGHLFAEKVLITCEAS